MPGATATGPRRAGRREWAGLAVLVIPMFLGTLDTSVLYLALPHFTADLRATGVEQLWIMDIYPFMTAGFLMLMGSLGDRIGRRRLLLIGSATFTVASVLAAFAVNAAMLIVLRAVMGIAGATVTPSTLGLVSKMFGDGRQRAIAVATCTGSLMVGAAAGPLVGGVMLQHFWWGSVFLLGVPLMIVLLVAGPVLLPEYRETTRRRLDVLSVALSLAAVLPVIYGVKSVIRDGWEPLTTTMIGAGLAFGVAFVVRQRTLEHPLIDLRIFGDRAVATTFVIILCVGLVLTGTYLYVPTFLQVVGGLSSFETGLWLAPQSLASIAATQIALYVAHRMRTVYAMAGGLAVAGAGCIMIAATGFSGPAPVAMGCLTIYFGAVPVITLAMNLMINSGPPAKAGVVSALLATNQHFGDALGLVALGTLGGVVYGHLLVVPANLPARAASSASESVSGAAAVAAELPPSAAEQLLESARSAFATALQAVTVTGGVLFLVLAMVTLLVLRKATSTALSEVESSRR